MGSEVWVDPNFLFFCYLAGTYEYIGCSLRIMNSHVFNTGTSLNETIADMCDNNECIPSAYKEQRGTDWFVVSPYNGMTIETCTTFCAANNFLLASIDEGYILRKFIDEVKNKFKVKLFLFLGIF